MEYAIVISVAIIGYLANKCIETYREELVYKRSINTKVEQTSDAALEELNRKFDKRLNDTHEIIQGTKIALETVKLQLAIKK